MITITSLSTSSSFEIKLDGIPADIGDDFALFEPRSDTDTSTAELRSTLLGRSTSLLDSSKDPSIERETLITLLLVLSPLLDLIRVVVAGDDLRAGPALEGRGGSAFIGFEGVGADRRFSGVLFRDDNRPLRLKEVTI